MTTVGKIKFNWTFGQLSLVSRASSLATRAGLIQVCEVFRAGRPTAAGLKHMERSGRRTGHWGI